MEPATSLIPFALQFISEVGLTKPVKFTTSLSLQLGDFIKRVDPRVQEVDLKKMVNQQLTFKNLPPQQASNEQSSTESNQRNHDEQMTTVNDN